MTDLDELIEQLEKATEPDRKLDLAIETEIGNLTLATWYNLPTYTSSIDAALTLVPEGRTVGMSLGKEGCGAWVEVQRDLPKIASACKSPALALCIAALKARLTNRGEVTGSPVSPHQKGSEL